MKLAKWAFGGIAAVTAVGVIAIGAVAIGGSASAQVPPVGGGNKMMDGGHRDEVLAGKLGVTVDELKAARGATRDQLIDEALAAGKITADQAEKLRNREPGAFRERLKDGKGPGRLMARGIVSTIDAAADLMKITKEQLMTELKGGKSLAQVAADHGVSRDALKTAILSDMKVKLDEAVKNGNLTQEQAANLSERLGDNIDEIIDKTPGQGFGELKEGMRIRPGAR